MKHKAPIQIRFADTDMLGHINNANYLTYMELARMSYFNEVINGANSINKLKGAPGANIIKTSGVPDAVDWKKEGVILAKAIIDYRRPIFIDDTLFVYITVDQISSKSFNFSYRFVVEKNNEETVCAEGSTLMVCFDYQLHKSIVMPEKWKERIVEYEGSEVK